MHYWKKPALGLPRCVPKTKALAITAIAAGLITLSTSSAYAEVVTPMRAHDLCNNMGLVARFGFNGSPGDQYRANQDTLAAALSDLGCHHIRSAVNTGFEDDLLEVLDGGVRNILLCATTSSVSGGYLDSSDTTLDTTLGRLQAIKAANRLRYIEGPNEWDQNGPQGDTNPADGQPDWSKDLADYQRKLYARAKEGGGSYTAYGVVNAALAGLTADNDYQTYTNDLGAISGTKFNWGGGHVYGGNNATYESFEYRFDEGAEGLSPTHLERLRTISPSNPLVITETGIPTSDNTPTETVKAKYLARIFMDVAERWPDPIRSLYYFELFDAALNSSDAGTMGLIHKETNGTFTYKPAYYAYRNMMWLIGSNYADNLTPVTITLSGATGISKQLIRRSDNVYLLFLWKDNLLWDNTAETPDADSNVNVTLAECQSRTVRVYRPAGPGVLSTLHQPVLSINTNGSGVLASSVPVNGGMTVLEFKTGTTGGLPAVRTVTPAWTPSL